jgi:hypothetical protein
MRPQSSPLALLFLDLIDRRVGPPGRDWFKRATTAGVVERAELTRSFTATARYLGKAVLDLQPEEATWLEALGVDWPIEGWGLDELGRATLLALAAERSPSADFQELVDDCYRHGDTRERQAVLRALPLLPEAERFLALGVDACRTSIQPLFEAIACENPYPAVHFPELNFNQMVLKALFTGVALQRIVGLERRVTPELTRMANDYASERRAAGRSVPSDLRLVTSE